MVRSKALFVGAALAAFVACVGTDPNLAGTQPAGDGGTTAVPCNAGYKSCGATCVAVTDPTYGCGDTTCDDKACPPASAGPRVCSGKACTAVSTTCGAGFKTCGGICVPTDAAHGCDEAARCTTCSPTESCAGSPSTCQCPGETKEATCLKVPCGMTKNSCGGDVDCGTAACPAPPAASCIGTRTLRTVAPTCEGNTCGSTPTDVVCPSNQACAITGAAGSAAACSVCATDSSCGPTCTACGGVAPHCKVSGAGSSCVICRTDADCSGGTCSPASTCTGISCPAGAVTETEPNDAPAAANAMGNQTAVYCGTVAPADVDYLTFTLPSGATQLALTQSTGAGGLVIDATADGTAFPFNSPAFKPGKVYLFKMSTTGAVSVAYKISVVIQP